MLEEQLRCVELAKDGHNLVICGQAGSGKSFVLDKISRELENAGKKVALTATTGIACQQFSPRLSPMTLHRWSGMQDGRHAIEDLCNLVKQDDHYRGAKQRITSCDTLIVDEVSMLSEHLFGCLETLCRVIRERNKPFGALQVILSGDFYQLPPVKNALYGDSGEFCFKHPCFNTAFPHVIELLTVHRQKEPTLIRAVHEISRGISSEDTVHLLAQVKRPIAEACAPIVNIYATNHQVDIENNDRISEMAGENVTYRSEDSGEVEYLRGMVAPKFLHLKKLCPVILLMNLSDQLVNGSMGRVLDFGQDGPLVEFASANITMEMKRETFSVYDPNTRSNRAERRQIPLKPAFAMTAHKSQGTSLDFVKVDCHLMNRPGQLGVAIGRAKTIEGLQVTNFHPSCLIQQPEEVRNFYTNATCGQPIADISCCINSATPGEEHLPRALPVPVGNNHQITEEELVAVEDVTEDDLVIFDHEIESCYEDDVALPPEIDRHTCVNKAKYAVEHTDFHRNVNQTLENLNSKKVDVFLGENFKTLHGIMAEHIQKDSVDQKDLSFAYKQQHAFMTSDTYKARCQNLFQKVELTSEEWDLAFRLSTQLRMLLVGKTAVEINAINPALNVSRRLPSSGLTSGAASKIRYVGGYVLAKIRYKHQEVAKRKVMKLDKESRQVVRQEEALVKLLSELCRTEQQIVIESTEPASLAETSRKQNVRQSLTHITDKAFTFFKQLCEVVIQLQTGEAVQLHGEHLHRTVSEKLHENDVLFKSYNEMYDEQFPTDLESLEASKTELQKQIFSEIINLFSKVMLKQLRQDFLAEVKKEKKLAHRKNILRSNKSSSEENSMNIVFTDFVEDVSAHKKLSHQRLKAFVQRTNKLPKFSKPQLQKLCDAYNIQYVTRETKAILETRLIEEINTRQSFSSPEIFGTTRPVLPRRGEKRKAKEDASKCAECRREDCDQEWILCNRCNKWYHRGCAEIFDESEWDNYVRSNADFICHNC